MLEQLEKEFFDAQEECAKKARAADKAVLKKHGFVNGYFPDGTSEAVKKQVMIECNKAIDEVKKDYPFYMNGFVEMEAGAEVVFRFLKSKVQ